MKRIIVCIVFLAVFGSTALADMRFNILSAHDNPNARYAIQNRPELKPLQAIYDDLPLYLKGFKLTSVELAFGKKLQTQTNWWRTPGVADKDAGPELRHRPTDLVLPLAAPSTITVSGLHNADPSQNHSHTDLHAIRDAEQHILGYVEFYYHDGHKVHAAAIYLKTDDQFVALKSAEDFAKRLEWETTKLTILKKWIDSNVHLVE